MREGYVRLFEFMAQKLVFGIAGADAVAAACFVDLCRAGSAALDDIELVPRHFPAYDALREAVSQKAVALAWAPPLLGSELTEAGLAVPIVVPVRHGATTFSAAFVTKKSTTKDHHDWPTKKALEAIRGKKVAWVEAKSASGYLIPRLHIASHGFDPTTFFSVEEYVGTHLGALDAVTSGRVDVATTFCRVDPASGKVLSAGWLRGDGKAIRDVEIAATTSPVPNDAVVIAVDRNDAEREALVRWFLAPDRTSQPLLLELMTTTTFRIAEADHFAPLGRVLHAARALGVGLE
jgi:phosphonate transport system substrate-binding protein